MPNKVYAFMGLAAKAGKVKSGNDSCEAALRSGKAYLIVVAEDASYNTKKRFSDICDYKGIDFRIYGFKEEIGRYIGKDLRSVIAILDSGFSKRLKELIDGDIKESGGVGIVKNQDI